MTRKSVLADYEQFKIAAESTNSRREMLAFLGLRAAGGNYQQIARWSKVHGIEVPVGKFAGDTTAAIFANTRPIEEMFVEHSPSTRGAIKRELRKLWSIWTCKECGLGEEWNGKSITLQLEHCNGVYDDNRIENLALLCPNCHSQTETFAGRSTRKNPEGKKSMTKHIICNANGCEIMVVNNAKKCLKHAAQARYGTSWPDLDTLWQMVYDIGYVETGKLVGVSDNAVKKHLVINSRELPIPPHKRGKK